MNEQREKLIGVVESMLTLIEDCRPSNYQSAVIIVDEILVRGFVQPGLSGQYEGNPMTTPDQIREAVERLKETVRFRNPQVLRWNDCDALEDHIKAQADRIAQLEAENAALRTRAEGWEGIENSLVDALRCCVAVLPDNHLYKREGNEALAAYREAKGQG